MIGEREFCGALAVLTLHRDHAGGYTVGPIDTVTAAFVAEWLDELFVANPPLGRCIDSKFSALPIDEHGERSMPVRELLDVLLMTAEHGRAPGYSTAVVA